MLRNAKADISKADETRGISLSALLVHIKGIIHAGISGPVWVRAEIRKVQPAKSGHVYLELEERDTGGQTIASTKGVIWGVYSRITGPDQ
jgi:exonuclease VII large subunit